MGSNALREMIVGRGEAVVWEAWGQRQEAGFVKEWQEGS